MVPCLSRSLCPLLCRFSSLMGGSTSCLRHVEELEWTPTHELLATPVNQRVLRPVLEELVSHGNVAPRTGSNGALFPKHSHKARPSFKSAALAVRAAGLLSSSSGVSGVDPLGALFKHPVQFPTLGFPG